MRGGRVKGPQARICIVTPAPPGSRAGNRVTALRWAGILRELGRRVTLAHELPERCDLLVAIHARKSHAAVKRFRARHPAAPLLVLLAGTDLYRDLRTSAAARASLELADRLLVLQPDATSVLPDRFHAKVRVVRQSVARPRGLPRPRPGAFEACVVGHLRAVKDPFRAALAARRLPAESRLTVVHVGAALTAAMRRQALAEAARNPRWRWLGELPRDATLVRIATSRLLVHTSKMEGGANVVSEAIVLGVPVLSSRISGSIGMLGKDYPGYFEVGDTAALAALLRRAETDRAFLPELRRRVRVLAPLYRPARERAAWRKILKELGF